MFKAFVFILLVTGQTVMFADVRGPYHTKTQCKKRIAEMTIKAKEYGALKFKGACVRLPELIV